MSDDVLVMIGPKASAVVISISLVRYIWSLYAPKPSRCHDANFVVTGGTGFVKITTTSFQIGKGLLFLA